ncbi:SusC/RagA family TonB-linked outer membrane protein [Pontibacter qinzhouensis]|uniref:SusC/RagA family TonB-linked outer membrane protein n=1 Tax=Pontibacter qinzhouensis TaxID=2603253 RepID=A0A5C8K9L2_9BACT|nr:SusC/RagA family TonB-linked outer membrane protein [Pontibacter qinzhouensis]TXK48073.1 SusC/RagA family TonB-linked outer membrane protein [Pontibacter qinzhouensis]
MRLKTSTLFKKQLAALLFLLICCCQAFAQTQTIQGVVQDTKGTPLPGVTVLIKGTTTGATTSTDGTYTLSAARPLTTQDVLVFSFIGFKTTEVPFAGATTISLKLQEDDKMLSEVVVTALGIKREQKALGYATQTVSSEQLNDARSNNFVNALSGKVAGLNLISPGSGPVNSVRVSLRGDNSMNPDGNNALIVLDGVPMNSGMTSSGVGNAYGAGSGNDVPIDFGNGIADINPDDIESVTVLKGASATALYGSRAANGALIITTKTGARKGKGIGVTINSNISMNDVLKWPDYQYEYGQGTGKAFNKEGQLYYSYGASEDGASTGGTSSAFGPKFDGQLYYQYDPATEGQSAERLPWRPYKDNIKGFWRTGYTVTNSVALEGGNETSSARASVTHSKNEWIMPNTGFERITAALSLNHKVSDKLKLTSKVNYTNKTSDNLPATGYNNQSVAYFMIFQNPNISLDAYRPIWRQGQEQIDQVHPFSSFIDNPYLIAYEMTNAINSHSTVGNLAATYAFSPKFDLMVRSGIAMAQEEREQRRPYSTANFQRGYFKQQNISNYEINTDALFSYHDKLSSRIDLRTSVGGNLMSRQYRAVNGAVESLVIPGVYKLSNGVSNPMMSTNNNNKKVNSLYALASVSFDDKIFVDVTGRNDWSSTLPVQNNSFFYPSISSSFILTELLQLPRPVSFAKLRLSAAQVGNDTDPYKTSKYYGQSEFPGSGSVPTTLHNVNFKPEITTSYEAGLEYIMFNGLVGFDLTFYRSFTRNQILDVPLDPTTGYTRAVLNSGNVRNQGVELVLNGKPIDNANFKWKTTVTWSKNANKVLELAEGMDGRQDIGYGGNATIQARVGGTTGDIYGFGFLRAPDGQIIYTDKGLPARPTEIQYIGRAYADWKGGFLNEFSYKNFRFSFLLDGQYGGMIYSQTHHKMSEQGKLEHTLRGREDGFIVGEGVVEMGDGTYSPNTTQVLLPDFYGDYYRRANVESNSFDASFVKLREVRVEFNLPRALLQRTKFMQQASFALYGRDLAMITNFPMFDPETAALNGSSILPGVEMGQLPTPRTMGMNVTLKF